MSSSPRTRLLIVVRHAEAEHSAPSDHARPLTRGGARDAEAAGEWLSDRGVRPGAALVSSAARARRTWEEMAGAAEWTVAADLQRALYEADPDSALDLVRRTPEDARTLVVVGHNPTMATLSVLLDDGEGDPSATSAMTHGFPTCSLAVFSVEPPWARLATGTARLRAFHVARA